MWFSIIDPMLVTYCDATSCLSNGCWMAHKQLMRNIFEGVSLFCKNEINLEKSLFELKGM